MTIVKALIGGLVGAVLATVALMYLRDGSLRGYEWFPIITGLLTGLGAKVLAAGRGGYLSGAIAAAVALLAILAGDEAVALWRLQGNDLGPVDASQITAEPIKLSITDAADRQNEQDGDAVDESADESDAGETEIEDEAEEDTAADDSERVVAESEAARLEAESRADRSMSATGDSTDGGLSVKKPPMNKKMIISYLCSGLGVLLAYQLGRGSLAASTVRTDHHRDTESSNEDA